VDLALGILGYLQRAFEDFLAMLPWKAMTPVMLAAGVCVLAVYVIDLFLKAKRDDIGDFLRQAGFKPVTQGLDSVLVHLEGFKVLEEPGRPRVIWAAEGAKNGIDWRIIEFKSARPGTGKYFQTVVQARVAGREFPLLFIGPRYFFAMHTEFVNYLEVIDKEYPKFFSAYTIKTTEPQLLRKMFVKPDILAVWDKHVGRNRVVESKADAVLFYNCEKSARFDLQDRLRQFQEAEFVVQTLMNILP